MKPSCPAERRTGNRPVGPGTIRQLRRFLVSVTPAMLPWVTENGLQKKTANSGILVEARM